MPTLLRGRNAIVTGSTSGIGLAIAHALAAEGCNVVLNGFGEPAALDGLRAVFHDRYGIVALYSPADMSRPPEVREMVQLCESRLGDVHILVNNAGIQHTSRLEEFPDDRWDAVIAVNLSAAFHAIKAALPGMRRCEFGRIVNIASAHGLVASKNKAAYVAAKHGILGLTKVVALETAETAITCNAICPGWTLTPLVQKQIDDFAAKESVDASTAAATLVGEKQPNKRFVSPDAIGAMTVFLCGTNGDSMTGEVVSMDGGWTAG